MSKIKQRNFEIPSNTYMCVCMPVYIHIYTYTYIQCSKIPIVSRRQKQSEKQHEKSVKKTNCKIVM